MDYYLLDSILLYARVLNHGVYIFRKYLILL